mgnify:FL=1
MMDTATILDELAARIEALEPTAKVHELDRFQVTIGADISLNAKRQVLLGAEGGIRRPTGGHWQTTLDVSTYYPSTQAERGERGIYSVAVQDAEDVLADVYAWAVSTAGILRIEPQPATIDDNGDGILQTERTIFIEFTRS